VLNAECRMLNVQDNSVVLFVRVRTKLDYSDFFIRGCMQRWNLIVFVDCGGVCEGDERIN